ncbi:MAG: dicarboxylate/amino acid:cation symporter [Pirellulales bacterium]|nr:dicarboxylate/amino acid:cation symporter [Pirellulales bacterium]
MPRKRLALHWRILLGLVVGAALGVGANALAARQLIPDLDGFVRNVVDPLGKVFLRLIFMVVIPLVFSALALGVAELGNVRKLGRVGLRTLWFTIGLSACAVVLGVSLVNVIQPGRYLSEEQQTALNEQYGGGAQQAVLAAKQAKPLANVLLDIIPENPLQEMVGAVDGSSKGDGMLAVMFFALAFGVAMIAVPEKTQTLKSVLDGVFAVCMAIIGFAMRLAPYGVACLVFAMTSRLGLALVPPLVGFIATVLVGLAIQMAVVYPVVLWLFARRSPWAFFRDISDAVATAFGTSSSNATLPTALRVAEENLRLPREVSRFVLTIGATGNQNGTALFEGVVVLFLAQVFHVELTITQQITVVLMSMLAGVGTAGVPGGSLPLIVVVMQSVGVPGEGIGIILGVDRLLDMCRTTLNVAGDLTIAACVAPREASVVRQN